MSGSLSKYYQIFASLPEAGYEESVRFLIDKISILFIDDYSDQCQNSEILEFNVNGYTYLFDLRDDEGDSNKINESRVVGVLGRVSHTTEKRDAGRMKGFIGPFTKLDKYKDFDKGHFVSHKINGSLDHNLYPQLRELNRGWSPQGKLFRSLERYCEQNPDTFLFTRPIYTDLSWIPRYLDYGIFTNEFGLLLNRFDNIKTL